MGTRDMESVRIRLIDAPVDYKKSEGLLRRLIEQATGLHTELVSHAPDLEIHSVARGRVSKGLSLLARNRTHRLLDYGEGFRRMATIPAPPRLWVTGENVRPPVGSWNGYLSFDLDQLGGRNEYFPVWWSYLKHFGTDGVNLLGRPVIPSELTSDRSSFVADRPRFMCAFIGNPTPMRLHAISAFRQLGEVDVYGSAVGRPVVQKELVARQYRFQLCFESDLYPGYVTEKPIEAWASGCIPVWWGLDAAQYLNTAAILNCADVGGFRRVLAKIVELESSREAENTVGSAPVLRRLPDLEPALELIRRILMIPPPT